MRLAMAATLIAATAIPSTRIGTPMPYTSLMMRPGLKAKPLARASATARASSATDSPNGS